VVLEHASRDAAPDLKGLTYQSTRRYGDTSLSFYSGRTQENIDFDTSTHEDVSSGNTDG
jgi:hypothetical protein